MWNLPPFSTHSVSSLLNTLWGVQMCQPGFLFLRPPRLLWPNIPNTDVQVRLVVSVSKMTHSRFHNTRTHARTARLGPHLLLRLLADIRPQFLHAYSSACSTNQSRDDAVMKLLTRGQWYVSRPYGVIHSSGDLGRRFKSPPERRYRAEDIFCRAFLSDALISRRRQLITAGI